MKPHPRRDPYRLMGEIFGQRYRLEEYVGMGSFGAVYRAVDVRLDRTVAIKILKPDLGDDETAGARELFQREALTAGRLIHPHIVAVTDVGEEAGFAYLVMEWLEGRTLEDELRARRTAFSPEEIKTLLSQITDALHTAHNAGVIHRDIKPSNIHLGRSGRPFVKILDFGIAKVITSSTAELASRTAGTVAYMSPEQITGSRIDRRADIYSMGILLYQMLTGELPFQGESQSHIIQQHIAVPAPLLSAVRPDLPSALSQVIQRALGKLPEARQQSAQELCDEFTSALYPLPNPPAEDAVSLHGQKTLRYSSAPLPLAEPPTASPAHESAKAQRKPMYALYFAAGGATVFFLISLLLSFVAIGFYPRELEFYLNHYSNIDVSAELFFLKYLLPNALHDALLGMLFGIFISELRPSALWSIARGRFIKAFVVHGATGALIFMGVYGLFVILVAIGNTQSPARLYLLSFCVERSLSLSIKFSIFLACFGFLAGTVICTLRIIFRKGVRYLKTN